MRHISDSKLAISTISLIVGAGLVLTPSPAEAQRSRGFGTALGVLAGAAILGQAARAMQAQPDQRRQRQSGSRSRNKSSAASDDSSSSSESSARQSSDTRTPEQRSAAIRNVALQRTESAEIDRARNMDRKRDVAGAIRDFIAQLEYRHKVLRGSGSANVKMSSGTNINQVTEGEIKRALETAYKNAQLYEYEKLAGEMWTRDRLMVRIIDRSTKELDSYFRGVGVKGAGMSDLIPVFETSARQVYSDALEAAEIIGVGHSFERFIRVIFEQSDRADETLWTIGADGHYERLIGNLVAEVPRERFIRDDRVLAADPLGLQKQFQFRFRARRALYDCMASSYPDLIAGRAPQSAALMQISSGQGAGLPVSNASGSGATRGAEVDGPINSGHGASQPQPAARPATEQDAGNVWQRTQRFVNATCTVALDPVAAEAKEGRMQPRPARWDSSGNDFAQRQRSPLTPIGGANPFR